MRDGGAARARLGRLDSVLGVKWAFRCLDRGLPASRTKPEAQVTVDGEVRPVEAELLEPPKALSA